MYCTGFRSESCVVDTITTVSICDELAKRLRLTEEEKERLYYGALLHDLGMLVVPSEIIDAPRQLNSEEIKTVRKHVYMTERLLNDLLRDDVKSIALAHHERIDGSGYPKKLKGINLNLEQRVLQVADTVTGMINQRSYREPLHKDQIISILNEEALKNRFDKSVVSTFINYYDDIIQSVQTGSTEIMKMYQTLNSQYNLVSKRFKI